ncbi:MAG: DNA cytosine methyltransferase [Gammaproteobacteria bacterium AqS3]|nr:DNA cytosine methyltransferase [Gammaproteobacteria bacterium AqS3]
MKRQPPPNRPIGVDLFAGVGGLSLGFEQAGFDIGAAVEIDPVHCAAHQFNFPDTAVIPRSVEGLTGDMIRNTSGVGGAPVDCVFGGAPCQGFSLIGQRALDDPRNRLVREFARIVAELDARTFVFENVKGLTLGRHRAFLDEIVEEFDRAGYAVRAPWRVLNAGNYGVPQHRERLILLGVRRGGTLPDYPEPTTSLPQARQRVGALPVGDWPDGPTCRDALDDLPDAEQFEALLDGDSVRTEAFGKPSAYTAQLRCLASDSWRFGYAREWNPAELTSSARTVHTDISRRRFRDTQAGTTEPISRFFKLPPDGVSNTLRAGTDGARGAFTSPRPIHYRHPRCITVREMARLHGFPDWFRFNVTKWHGARQIGNAVPPPLARAIAGEIISALGIAPHRPERVLRLGSAELLSFDMSGAARHFGVARLSGRRDRRSGARKRRQADIERERAGAF